MKICENCGIEHEGTYGSGRFCSVKCSRGFSTKAKRKEINEKVSKSIKHKLNNGETVGYFKPKNIKIKYCKSCGDIITGRKLLCNDCHDFHKYTELFKKFNVYDKNIKIAVNKTLSIIKNEYFNNNLGLGQLREKYNVQFNTIHFFLKRNGIKLRNNEEAGELAYEMKRLSPSSSKKYKTELHETWDGKRVYLRSSYESAYANELDEYKINYTVESLRIKYYDSIKNKNRIAIPDFYLIDLNMIVEIKSNWALDLQNMKDKFKEYHNKGYKTKLIVDGSEIKI